MNSYIQLVKDRLVPNDPPLNYEPCSVEDIYDDVLNEALKVNKVNPIFEYTSSELYAEVDDEIFVEDNTENDAEERVSNENNVGRVSK